MKKNLVLQSPRLFFTALFKYPTLYPIFNWRQRQVAWLALSSRPNLCISFHSAQMVSFSLVPHNVKCVTGYTGPLSDTGYTVVSLITVSASAWYKYCIANEQSHKKIKTLHCQKSHEEAIKVLSKHSKRADLPLIQMTWKLDLKVQLTTIKIPSIKPSSTMKRADEVAPFYCPVNECRRRRYRYIVWVCDCKWSQRTRYADPERSCSLINNAPGSRQMKRVYVRLAAEDAAQYVSARWAAELSFLCSTTWKVRTLPVINWRGYRAIKR